MACRLRLIHIIIMAALYARKGDSQALKPLIGAAAGSQLLSFNPVPDIVSARLKGSNPFSTNNIAYIASDGVLLTEANSITKLLGKSQIQIYSDTKNSQCSAIVPCFISGGESVLPFQHAAAIGAWVEWEACRLRPSALLQGQGLRDTLRKLEEALAGGHAFLVGATFTLADVSSSLPQRFFNHACPFSRG